MSARVTLFQRHPELTRWSACFALAIFFHIAGVAAMLARWSDDADMMAAGPVVMLDLAPMAVAPQLDPNDLPPGPVQTISEPEPVPDPVEKVEIEPDPTPEPQVSITPPKPEKPKEKKKQKKRSDVASAPSRVDQSADRAAAPMPGASARDSNAIPNWRSMLVSQLERHKTYPSEAQSRGERGVTVVAFSIDRNGGVHNVRVVRSSGSDSLDRATASLPQRAAPLPPPPPEMGGQVAISVPIRYTIR